MRRGFNARRDAKQLSRNRSRIARLDPDTSSRYEDLDDDVVPAVRPQQQTASSNGSGTGRGGGASTRPNPFDRRGAQSIANTGVRNADIVYKIKVPAQRKFDAKWLVKQINQKIENFKPLLIQETARGDIEFFVRDEDTASAIRVNNRRIYHRESSTRVEIYVNRVTAPWMSLRRTDVDIINRVVDRRYNAESRMIDLSDFGNDNEFTSRDMLMTLTKGNVMLAVIDRIDERYGNITALNLANNRLRHLDYAAALVSIAKFIKVLEMSHNLVSSEEELQKFGGLPVETFFFEGNPICEQMSSASIYLSFVQKIFPRCSMLDGVPVTPLLTGPENDGGDLLPYRGGFYKDDQIRELVEQFIISFFQLYDGVGGSSTRKQLYQAYDENESKFTLTITLLNGGPKIQADVYDPYVRISHNVLAQEYFQRNRSARTARGAMDIAVALSKLPITKHMEETFMVDVFMVTNDLLGFTVQGLFENGRIAVGENEDRNLCYFSRSFTVAPRDGGKVAVISDQLFITSASVERISKYRGLMNQVKENGSATEQQQQQQNMQSPVTQMTIGMNGIGFNGEPSKDMKDELIMAFCQFSGMVVPWSEKCLADFAWNYNAACQKFMEIRESVPAEAFSR